MFGVFTFWQNSASINMVQSKVQIIGHLGQILLDTLWTDQWRVNGEEGLVETASECYGGPWWAIVGHVCLLISTP